MRFSSQTRFNKELYEISAVLNYAIVQQLAFFAFVCITQLFLALRYLTCIIIVLATSKGPLGAMLYTIDIIPTIMLGIVMYDYTYWQTLIRYAWL